MLRAYCRASAEVAASFLTALWHHCSFCLQLLERVHQSVDVLGGMRCRYLAAQACVAFGDDGVAKANHKDAKLKQAFAHGDCFGGVVHDDGADCCWAGQHVKACGFELGAGVLHVVLQSLHSMRLAQHDLYRGVCARGDGDGKSVAKERGTAALNEKIDGLLTRGDKAACSAAEGFAERACEDVDAAGVARVTIDHAKVFVGASSEFAHDSMTVAVVDDEHRVIFIAEFSHGGQVCDAAFHAEDAIGDDPDLPGNIFVCPRGLQGGTQTLFAFEDVIAIDGLVQAFFDDGCEANRIDDAGVIEFIADDDVSRLAERGEHSFVGGPCADEAVACLRTHQSRDGLFERPVRAEGAADESHACGACAVVSQSFNAALDNFWVIGKAQVVVAAKAEHFLWLAVEQHRHFGVHRALDGLELLPKAIGAELGEEGGCAGSKVRHGAKGSTAGVSEEASKSPQSRRF